MEKIKENKYTIAGIAAATVAFGYLLYRVVGPKEHRPSPNCMTRSEIDAFHKSLSTPEWQNYQAIDNTLSVENCSKLLKNMFKV